MGLSGNGMVHPSSSEVGTQQTKVDSCFIIIIIINTKLQMIVDSFFIIIIIIVLTASCFSHTVGLGVSFPLCPFSRPLYFQLLPWLGQILSCLHLVSLVYVSPSRVCKACQCFFSSRTIFPYHPNLPILISGVISVSEIFILEILSTYYMFSYID